MTVQRMMTAVDSLRKAADGEDTIFESAKRMVDLLASSSDSATNGLAGWRRIYDRQGSRFDSTLTMLDSCIGVLKRAANVVDSLTKQKGQKKIGKN